MSKTILCDVPMQKIETVSYGGTGNAEIKYAGKVIYPINAVLADRMKKEDDIKIILLKTKSIKDDLQGNLVENTRKFKEELENINSRIGAKISYVEIESEFEETREVLERMLTDILENIDDKTSILADITYGPKPHQMIVMTALAFADKFFKANIDTIVYGKVDMIRNKEKYNDERTHPENPELYDVSFLYYLTNLTKMIEVPSREMAMNLLKKFLD
jgi:hypothetical protein